MSGTDAEFWVGTDRGNRASSDQMLDTNEREWVIEGVAIHCVFQRFTGRLDRLQRISRGTAFDTGGTVEAVHSGELIDGVRRHHAHDGG